MKKIVWLLLIILSCSVALSFYQFPIAKADITTTRTFMGQSPDGWLNYMASTYSAAHNTYQGVNGGTNWLWIGQYYTSPWYEVERSFLYFDTSAIPIGATITSAILSLYVQQDYSSTNFNVTIQNGQPTYPHNPLALTDYYYSWYGGNGGTRNTNEIGGIGYWNITLNSEGYGYIQHAGETKLALRSSNDINNVAPTSNEFIKLFDQEMGESYAPILYVTYTMGGAGGPVGGGGEVNYLIHGPYYEDGNNATTLVSCVLTQPYNSSLSFNLDGTDGNADTVNVTIDQPASYLAWNISDVYNYTRIYWFLNTTFDEVWVFVPKPSEPYYPYEFSVTDFYGMNNPYLETVINVNGQSRIVERKKLDVANTLTFFMIQWHKYDLRFRCDQGTYIIPFSAENTFLTNIPVLAGSFPSTTYTYPTVTVARTSGSLVTVTYVDPTESTVWVYFQIYHYIGQTGVEDYALNTTGSSYSLAWSDADNTTDYYVHTQAYADNQVWDWVLPALVGAYGTNPWTGIVSSFGSLPLIDVDLTQIIAAAIILCVLGIFSYASAGVGCILSLIVAGIFIYLGWYVMSAPMFIFAGFVAAFVMIEEAKRTEREV